VTIRLSPALIAAIDHLVAKKGHSRSDVMREIVGLALGTWPKLKAKRK
jgi:Arc/MetJ-type ribon-helix-helix transcriptional regulator